MTTTFFHQKDKAKEFTNKYKLYHTETTMPDME